MPEEGINQEEAAARDDSPTHIPPSKEPSVFRLLIALAGSIVVAEVLVMLLLSVIPNLSLRAASLLDGILLAAVSLPALYFFMFRPLVLHIAERKRAEEAIKRLNEDLQRNVAKLEAANQELDAFTYSVSHDLRVPLRSIDGFSRLILRKDRGTSVRGVPGADLMCSGRRFIQ